MPLVTVKNKYQIVIPAKVRKEAGVNVGDLLEASIEKGKIVLSPRVAIDPSQFPNADNEYTPAQRRKIDARLAKSLRDVKKGHAYGPFNTHKEFIASLRAKSQKLAVKKTQKPQ